MASFNIHVDDEIATEFRSEVTLKYGTIRGNVEKGFEDALKAWIDSQRRKRGATK